MVLRIGQLMSFRRLVLLLVIVLLTASACSSEPAAPLAEGEQIPPSPAGASPEAEKIGSPGETGVPADLPDAVLAAIPIDGSPASVAPVGDHVWVADAESSLLWRVARESGEVVDTVKYGPKDQSPYFAGLQDVRIYRADDSIFVLGGPNGREAVRVQAQTGKILERLQVESPLGATIARGAIWVGSFDPYEVLRVDLRTNKVTDRIPSEGPTGLGVGYGRVWILNHRGNTVSAIDPGSSKLMEEIAVNVPFPMRLGVGEGGVWVSSPISSTVLRIDPKRSKVAASITVPGDPQDFAFGEGAVWVGTAEGVTRIDPRTNEMTGTVTLGGHPWGVLAFDEDGFLWAASPDQRTLFKIDPQKA